MPGRESLRDRPLALLQAAPIVLARPADGHFPTLAQIIRVNLSERRPEPSQSCEATDLAQTGTHPPGDARALGERDLAARIARPRSKRDQDQVVEVPGFQAWDTGDKRGGSG
jgi:hypothetical protein